MVTGSGDGIMNELSRDIDVNADFGKQGGGALSGTFFVSDTEKTAFSTIALDINHMAEEVNFPLGRPVTGEEVTEQSAAMTFGGQPISDPNGILTELGPLEDMISVAVEIDVNGTESYPTVAAEQLGEQAELRLGTLEA